MQRFGLANNFLSHFFIDPASQAAENMLLDMAIKTINNIVTFFKFIYK